MPPITTGLLLWLDADDAATLTVVGSDVTAWEDKASSAVFSLPSGGIAPTLNTTYFQRPSVDFGLGTQSVVLRTSTPVAFSRPITIFQTLYWPSTSSTYAALSLQDGVASNALQGGATPSSAFVYRSTQGSGGLQTTAAPPLAYAYATNQSTVATGAWHTIVYQTPTAMSGAVIRYDGAAVAIATAGTAPSSGQFDTVGSSDGLYLANGAFAEVLVYDGALSTTDIQSIEAYLTAKWSSAGGGTDVDVDASGVSAAAAVGTISTGTGVAVDITGVAGSAALGGFVVSAGADAVVTGAALQSGLGSVVVSASGQTTVFGVEADAAVSQVLVWSAVNDTQSTGWAPVNTAQGSPWLGVGPGTVAVTEFDGPGSAAIASEPLAGSSSFSYTPNAVVWRPVLTSA